MNGVQGRLVGFVVNPLAGIGGRLGFKGSDGAYGVKALMMGADLVSPARAERFIDALVEGVIRERISVGILAATGIMGYEEARKALGALDVEELSCVPRGLWPTTAHDTRRCARMMVQAGVDILVFVGGDGTARDIYESVGREVPVLGVPAGVKVYSAVFAVNPEAAAEVVLSFLSGRADLQERDVVDVDEDEFRRGRLVLRRYGSLLVPVSEGVVPSSKETSRGGDAEGIAEFILDNLVKPCTLLILGPGTTTSRIADAMGAPKTLLGVDVYHEGRPVALDVNEEELYSIVRRHVAKKGKVYLVLSPIGGQGYILGRGNQQISPRILRLIGLGNIIAVSSEEKLRRLDALRVDTGDRELDSQLRGYMKVLTGYGRWRLMRVL